jgi:hypothetical protein
VDHGSPLASFLPWVTMHNIHLSILHSERTPDIFLCRITAGDLQVRPGKERGERGAKNRSCLNRGHLFLDIPLCHENGSKSLSGAPSCKLLNLVFCAGWLLLERLCGQLEVPLATALIHVHPEIPFSLRCCDSSSEPMNMYAYELGLLYDYSKGLTNRILVRRSMPQKLSTIAWYSCRCCELREHGA